MSHKPKPDPDHPFLNERTISVKRRQAEARAIAKRDARVNTEAFRKQLCDEAAESIERIQKARRK